MQQFKFIIYLFTIIFLVSSNNLEAQNKNNKRYSSSSSHSKSCGGCGRKVSINSKAGMTCPYCGVVWGSENTTTEYGNSNYNTNDYGYSNTKCYCGRAKSSSEIMCYKCRTTCVCGGNKNASEVMCIKCKTTCICGRKKNASDVLCLKCKTTCICGGYKAAFEIMCKKCRQQY